MNCKQGDLAIIVKSKAGNEGKIVTVNKFLGEVEGWDGDDRWEIDVKIRGTFGRTCYHIRDSQLKPIRDTDGKDEMLTIVGKPQQLVGSL